MDVDVDAHSPERGVAGVRVGVRVGVDVVDVNISSYTPSPPSKSILLAARPEKEVVI